MAPNPIKPNLNSRFLDKVRRPFLVSNGDNFLRPYGLTNREKKVFLDILY